MKAQNSNIINQLAKIDLELLNILKSDIKKQSLMVTGKLLNMATITYDSELLDIIKKDVELFKAKLCTQQNSLAKAS